MTDTSTEFEFITYELLNEGLVARIMLDRPDARNAQNRGMLVELDEAFRRAEQDDTVRVIILGGNGKLFSSGHDMGSAVAMEEYRSHPTSKMDGATKSGAEARMRQEWHYYFDNTRRWRNLRKITVAQVHGKVYGAALMLMWACDLIVAAEGTTFADVVGARLGMCGLEYFAHPWEFGARKTKELLLTGDCIDADEAHALGMVSKVFPAAELSDKTVELAMRIAALPSMTALMIKESVNQTQDNQGFYNALNACFSIHQLNHSHWAEIHDDKFPAAQVADGIPDWRNAPPVVPAEKTSVRAAAS